MKKAIKVIIVILLLLMVYYGIKKDLDSVRDKKVQDDNNINWLHVEDSNLLDNKNNKVQLKGISTHGIQWYSELYSYENIKKLKEVWGINVFRIAMYTDPDMEGYINNNNLKEEVVKIVDYAIELDLYVIVDWHILNDNNPNKYENEAMEFFDEISKKYKDTPNIIYEICNEPNGVNWIDVKNYAEKIIKVIRNNSSKSLIIVGIPEWCRDLKSVQNNPLNLDNIMYSVHFYAGSDSDNLRKNMSDFLDKKLPIFVSECGITNNTGNGKIYEEEFNKWIKYLDQKNISWVFWAFSNKDETSSILTIDYNPKNEELLDDDVNNDFNNYLTETGKIVKKIFSNYR